MRAELEALEGTIGHAFRDRHLLYRALTHSSHVHEKTAAGETGLLDNEQLEFLGDSILGFLISESLVQHFPGLAEGRLSKLKAHLVSASHLHLVAQRLDLGRHLVLGRGEELSGGRSKKALLANGVEALLAALYIDAGMEAARDFVARYVVGDLDDLLEGTGLPVVDYKSALQEFAQARKLPQPHYTIVGERGPEHAKTFTVEVRVGREWSGQAEAFSKKSAGQKAAQMLLQRLIAGSVEDGGSPQEPAT